MQHHARIVRGGQNTLPHVRAQLEQEGKVCVANPDYYERVYNTFAIDDARALTARASTAPVGDSRRVFVIVAANMTAEAQNALLKLFEDPQSRSDFVLVVPHPESLLPTLRSRLEELKITQQKTGSSLAEAKKFLSLSPDARIKEIAKLIEKNDDDERNLDRITSFLNALEEVCAARIQDPAMQEGLRALYKTKQATADVGSIKHVLEYLALSIPVW